VSAATLFLWLGLAPAAHAIDAIVLEVGEMRVAGIPVEGASARLDLLSDQQTRVTITARAAALPDPVNKLSDLAFVCTTPVMNPSSTT
jgi:hypothetical protein